mmetsp:Transcript_37884/g.98013  ORF Transcript_37884/g.98013 Transcript_37884/m.98013 type:complete len:393 (+) Transcript_37884:60-1238(+)
MALVVFPGPKLQGRQAPSGPRRRPSPSLEEVAVRVDEHPHQRLAVNELDVGSPPDHRVQVGLRDAEVDVDAQQALRPYAGEEALYHVPVVATRHRIGARLRRHLDTRRLEGSVLVLIAGDKHHVLEVLQPRGLRQGVQVAVPHVLGVRHGDLLKAPGAPPLLDKPEASLEEPGRVHVAQVRGGERQVGEHLVAVGRQVRQRCTHDDSAEGMRDEAQAAQCWLPTAGAPLADERRHLVGKSGAHALKVGVLVLLIRQGAQVEAAREDQCDVVPQQPHVVRVPLKPVHEHHDVDTVMRGRALVGERMGSWKVFDAPLGTVRRAGVALRKEDGVRVWRHRHRQVLQRQRRQALEVRRCAQALGGRLVLGPELALLGPKDGVCGAHCVEHALAHAL